MTTYSPRLTVYDVVGDAATVFAHAPAMRFVYAPDGPVTIRSREGEDTFGTDEGRFAKGALDVAGRAWVFELAPAQAGLATGDGIEIVLSHPLTPDFTGPAILRADRVASDAGARTPRHGHRGPGIRRLLRGTISAEVGETVERFAAGRAWFENGRDWVVGQNVSGGENVFVRVMLLPAELAGGISSFVAATPEDAARPRAVNYRLFGEVAVER